MQVDWQTVQDLGILRPEGHQLSLFDWANATRTLGGAQRLKERFRHPLEDIATIRQTQDAVAWLMQNGHHFDPLLGTSAWQTVDRYVESRVVALDYPHRLILWLDSWWLRFLNADLYREVLASLALTQMLVHHASRIEAEFAGQVLPPLIERWFARLRECLAAEPLNRLAQAKSVHRCRPPRVLALDHALRREEFSSLRLFADLIYELDLWLSLAATTRKRGLVLPTFLEGSAPILEVEDLIHPLLDAPVGNPLRISPADRLVFLTGPNMAGKSTYLKAAGIAIHLAHVGMGVPARTCRLSLFGCLFSGINTTDNVRLGHSYFYREVRRVREITDVLNEGIPTFALFDEMFKGTNLKDATEACLTVLSGFAQCENSAFIVASHIAELAEPISALPGSAFLRFEASVRDGQALFDHRVASGVSGQRLGMHILEQEGVLSRLAALGGRVAGT